MNTTAMKSTTINGVEIDDTFAEAFGMSGTGLIITADTREVGACICAIDPDRLWHLRHRLRR